MGDFPGASPAVGSSRSRSAVNPKGAWSETGRNCVPLGCPREGTYAQKLWLRSWLSLRMLMQVEIAWKVLRQKVPRECSVVGDFPGASPAVGSSRSRSPVIPARVCALRQVAVGCLVVALGKNLRAEALVAIVVVRPNVITIQIAWTVSRQKVPGEYVRSCWKAFRGTASSGHPSGSAVTRDSLRECPAGKQEPFGGLWARSCQGECQKLLDTPLSAPCAETRYEGVWRSHPGHRFVFFPHSPVCPAAVRSGTSRHACLKGVPGNEVTRRSLLLSCCEALSGIELLFGKCRVTELSAIVHEASGKRLLGLRKRFPETSWRESSHER